LAINQIWKFKKEKSVLLYSWLLIGTYRHLAIWNLFSGNLANLSQFFSEQSLVQVKIIFFRLKIGENSPQQDHCASHESLVELWRVRRERDSTEFWNLLLQYQLELSVIHYEDVCKSKMLTCDNTHLQQPHNSVLPCPSFEFFFSAISLPKM